MILCNSDKKSDLFNATHTLTKRAAMLMVVLATAMALLLTGCGGGIQGTYVLDESDPITLEVHNDGTFLLKYGYKSVAGTYEQNEDGSYLLKVTDSEGGVVAWFEGRFESEAFIAAGGAVGPLAGIGLLMPSMQNVSFKKTSNEVSGDAPTVVLSTSTGEGSSSDGVELRFDTEHLIYDHLMSLGYEVEEPEQTGDETIYHVTSLGAVITITDNGKTAIVESTDETIPEELLAELLWISGLDRSQAEDFARELMTNIDFRAKSEESEYTHTTTDPQITFLCTDLANFNYSKITISIP